MQRSSASAQPGLCLSPPALLLTPCLVQAEPSMSVEEIQQRAAALRQQKAAGSAKEGLIEVSMTSRMRWLVLTAMRTARPVLAAATGLAKQRACGGSCGCHEHSLRLPGQPAPTPSPGSFLRLKVAIISDATLCLQPAASTFIASLSLALTWPGCDGGGAADQVAGPCGCRPQHRACDWHCGGHGGHPAGHQLAAGRAVRPHLLSRPPAMRVPPGDGEALPECVSWGPPLGCRPARAVGVSPSHCSAA